MTTPKRFPLLALLLLCSPARAWVAQGGIASSFNPQDYHDGKMYGPLSPDQQAQYEAWSADQKKAPQDPDSKPTAAEPGGGQAADQAPIPAANAEAAKVNNLDGALNETGLGTPIEGQLPAGTSVKDINGRRYYCDTSACTLCSSADCAGVIPPQNLPVNNQVAQNGGNLNGGIQAGGGRGATRGGGRGVTRGGASGYGSTGIVGGTAGSGSGGVNGANGTAGETGETDGTANGGSASSSGKGGRTDEPKPRTISALVQDVVMPAVDTLASNANSGSATTGGGAGGITGVAGKQPAGGAPQVRYTGGSFDSLSDINNSRALGDAGKMLGDGATNGEAIKAGRTGKQTNAFGTTKGDHQ